MQRAPCGESPRRFPLAYGPATSSFPPLVRWLLAHYLPEGLELMATSGPVHDIDVADWRDITKRLGQSDPRTTIPRTIDVLPAGGRLLVVCPLPPPAGHTVFVGLNFLRCDEVRRVALADPRLRLELVVRPPANVTNTAVEGHLFAKDALRG